MKNFLLILFLLIPIQNLSATSNYNILISDLEHINKVVKNHLNIVSYGFECDLHIKSTGKILKNRCYYFLNNFLDSANKTIKNQKMFSAKYQDNFNSKEFLKMYKSLRIEQKERLNYLFNEIKLDNELCLKLSFEQYKLYEELNELL